MRLGPDVCRDLEQALSREWLLTNGVGGFAAGTASGAAARCSHALLVVSPRPPRPRLVALTRLEERLQREDGESLALGCIVYPGGVTQPQGHLLLEEFRLDPWPVYRYRAWDTVMEKSLLLVHGHDAVLVQYRQLEGPPLRLLVTPLFTLREEGALRHEDAEVGGVAQMVPGRVRLELYAGLPPVVVWHNAVAFMPARAWYHAIQYPADHVQEDAFAPGHFQGPLGPGRPLQLVASTDEDLFRSLAAAGRLGTPPASSLADCAQALEEAERSRLKWVREEGLAGIEWTARQAAAAHRGAEPMPEEPAASTEQAAGDEEHGARLSLAADAFLVGGAGGYSLLGACPGVADRTGEVLRALPGLLLVTRQFDAARDLLAACVQRLDDGVLPARLSEPAGPKAGADASLWLVHAADLYARRSEDVDFLRGILVPALEQMMQYLRAGTRHGLGVGRDGLLAMETPGDAGSPGADPRAASTASRAAAPASRRVKSAELNALWFHALAALSSMARRAERRENAAFYAAWAREHQRAFMETFWSEARGYCDDAVAEEWRDETLRPGQVLAVSLPPALLPVEEAARMLSVVERELLTPYGLRGESARRAPTRAARQSPPAGRKASRGSASPRAASAASAAVSPWLLAHFITAYLRVHRRSPAALALARAWLGPLLDHLAGAGSVPEAFEATAPHRALGAQAYAPNVAAVLGLWAEELAPATVASAAGPCSLWPATISHSHDAGLE